MIIFWVLIVCASAMAVAQDADPGLALYHFGWYNAIAIAFFVIAATRKTRSALAVAGCAVIVFSGVAAGLMGPDTHTIAGTPGASVADAQIGGSFAFPMKPGPVVFHRGSSAVAIGGGRRYSGGFIFWQVPRTVVHVDAYDLRGNSLTVTQPTNVSFLSPVLLMGQSTIIDGMRVRYDTFSVPALRRSIKAVLFDEQQAAQLRVDPPIIGEPAVLFVVSNDADRMLAGGIGIVPSGTRKQIGGLILGASVQQYPAVVVAAAPYVPALVFGIVLLIVAAVRAVVTQNAVPLEKEKPSILTAGQTSE